VTATDLTPRRLGAADLDVVCELLAASDLAVLGHTDFTPDDIEADLRRDDLEAYGVDDGTGRLVGYAWTAVHGDSERADVDVYVHPEHPDQGLGPALLAYVEARAAALVAPAGHDEAVLDLGVYRQDERTQAWLRERGFEVGTTFVRMRIDFDGPLPEPVLPDGLTVRLVEDEAELRAAHDVFERGFVEHYSHAWTSYEHWHERLTERGPGFARVWLAELDGTPAGMLVGTRHFEPDDDAGYVRTLATAPDARGRGAGKALLRTYFRMCQQEGRKAVYLHVDVANVTDALRLYKSVGMREFLTIDAWSKRVPVSG
jgi:mycothiol synthase